MKSMVRKVMLTIERRKNVAKRIEELTQLRLKERTRPCLVHPETKNFSRFLLILNFAAHA